MSQSMELSIVDYEELWDAIHRTRSTTNTVTVKKRQLEALLMDYAKLYDDKHHDTTARQARWLRK